LRTSLTSGKIYLDTDVSRIDASDTHETEQKDPEDKDHAANCQHAKEISAEATEPLLGVNVAIENRGGHRNLSFLPREARRV
jgi:hypothetical protein